MGGKPKAPVIVMPPTPEPTPYNPATDPAVQAAMPAPTPQASPTARRSSDGGRGGPAALAAGMGMNNTVLTGPLGTMGSRSDTRRSSLLGL